MDDTAPARRWIQSLPWLALGGMIAGYMGLFAWLSVARHASLDSNALDLGYVTQAIWNTAYGRPFAFTTFEGARYQLDIALGEFRRADNLLGYHVEPLLVFFAPLMILWPDPRLLLIVQTIGIALGAIPAYLLARNKLGDAAPALVFPALYLLAPSLEAANLSDFHAVSLSPTFFLGAYFCLERRKWAGYAIFALLALMCKEECALLAAALGVYAALAHKPRWIGIATGAAALLWFALAVGVVMPSINGLGGSPFFVRYQHLGQTPTDILINLFHWPNPLLAWLTQPAILRYGLLLLATGGGVVLFGPQGWALALPAIAVNVLSSYAWMHSGGGHYSASIVAFLIIGAVEGAAWWGRRWPARRRPVTRVAASLAFGVGLAGHIWMGATPLSSRWFAPAPTAHDRLARQALAQIPAEADVIAQSALYPHVATRRRAILFPSSSDAEYIALDVTTTTYPVSPAGYRQAVDEALTRPGYQICFAQDGVIILGRGLEEGLALDTPAFRSFAPATVPAQIGVAVAFQGGLELEGYRIEPGLTPQIVTYWRAAEPLSESYRPALFFTKAGGALAWAYDEGTPTDIWFPTDQWPAGQTMRLAFPPLNLASFETVLVGVLREGGDAWSLAGRLPIAASPGPTYDGETLTRLFDARAGGD